MHVLRAGPLTTTWFPEHGMVGASLTHEGEELLGQRGGLDAHLERLAFGIPLLAPWANRLGGLRYGEVEIRPQDAKLDANGLPKDGAMADDRAHQRARHPRRPAQRAAGSQLRGDVHGAGG